ncbi:MAG: 50S ribosomal protein L28 [Candidatus Wallbacteria bacterium]|nr:50S ribosomal protein L28 [Candidatus Wallbacteria bacterium]
MGKMCEVCGKIPWMGFQVSHSHIRTKKRWYPNLQKVRARIGGGTKKMMVCTRCLKAGKVERAISKPAGEKVAAAV